MPSVGKLTIDLEAGTFQYTSALDKAGVDAEKAAGRIKGALGKVDTHEARGGLQLLGEEIGVHLPRHVTSFLATLPGIGAAMEAAFPILAVIAVGDAILKASEASAKHAAEVKKAAAEEVNAEIKERDRVNTLETLNLKLDDQIRKLEGGVGKNQLAIAIREAHTEADAFFYSLSQGFVKANEKIEESTGWWTQIKSAAIAAAVNGTSGLAQQIAANHVLNESLEKVNKAQEAVSDARKRFAEIDLNGNEKDVIEQQRNGLTLLKGDYSDLINKLKDARGAFAFANPNDTVGISQFTNQINAAISGMQGAGDEIQTLQKKTKVAGLEAAKETADAAEKSWNNQKLVAEANTKQIIAQYELEFAQGKRSAESLGAARQAVLDKEFNAELAHFDKLAQLYASDKAKVEQIEAQKQAFIANHNTEELKSTTTIFDLINKGRKEVGAEAQKFYAGVSDASQRMTEEELKAAEKANKQIIDDTNLILALGDKKTKNIDEEIARLTKLIGTYKLEGALAQGVYTEIHRLELERQKDINDEMLASGNLGKIFHATFNQMIQDGQQWKIKLADVFKQTVDGFNSNMSSFLTTGKANWKSLETSAIQSIIKIELQYLESNLLMIAGDKSAHQAKTTIDAQDKLADAKATFRKVYKNVSDWPVIGPILAPELAAGAFAAVMAFNSGGLVPGSGNSDIVPALLTPGERVLTVDENVALTKSVAAGQGNSGTQNIHYNPVIMGNADEKKLGEHFAKAARGEFRRRLGTRF